MCGRAPANHWAQSRHPQQLVTRRWRRQASPRWSPAAGSCRRSSARGRLDARSHMHVRSALKADILMRLCIVHQSNAPPASARNISVCTLLVRNKALFLERSPSTAHRQNAQLTKECNVWREQGPPMHENCLDLRVGFRHLKKLECFPTLSPCACRPPRPWRRPGRGARCGSAPRPPTPTWRPPHATPAPSQCTTSVMSQCSFELSSLARSVAACNQPTGPDAPSARCFQTPE